LRQSQLINAVAVAIGRISPLIKPDANDRVSKTVTALSVEDALNQGTLILLAEDNITNQQVIGRQLNMLGYTCETADDGKIALEAWRHKDYALLLTDCHMPRMDGFELTEAVRADEAKTGRRSPIIAVTANALEGEAERCIAEGMDDYLSKPLAMADLKAVLQKWMPNAKPSITEDVEAPHTESDTLARKTVKLDTKNVLKPTHLRESFGDDDTLIKEILLDYVAPTQSIVQEIDIAFEARDAQAISAAAHKLKSSSRSVGANALADLCIDLEKAGKSDDWGRIEIEYPKLASAIEAVTKAIKAFNC
jgi:CheY-like chemotaxis protein/HPt (histidine-containing phosphotransfer) domain-containing protein